MHALRFLALIALLLAGAGGWGSFVVAVLRRAGWRAAPDVIDAPLQLAVGCALFLCVGGAFVAAGVAVFKVLFAWHALGAAFLCGRALSVRRTLWRGGTRAVDVGAVVLVTVFLGVLALGMGVGISPLNPNDDDPGYVYLAQRLLHTGGLIDPFNFRRITSYGGSTLYDSLLVRVSGTSTLRAFDFVFGAAILLAVAVGSRRRRWMPLGLLVLGIGVVIGQGVGPVVNLSPGLSVTALTLSVLVLVRRTAHNDADALRVAPVLGLFLAAIASLRFYFVIPAGLAVVGSYWVVSSRRCWRAVVWMVAWGAIGLGGWAVASWRSSGTPFFALISGNYNASVPSGGDPQLTVGGYFRFLWSIFTVDDIGYVAVFVVLVGVGLVLSDRVHPERGIVTVTAGLSCLVTLAFFAKVFAGSDFTDPARFVAPSTLACGLFAVNTLWPTRQQEAPRPPRQGLPGRSRWARPAVTVLAGVVFAGILFGTSLHQLAHSTRVTLSSGVDVLRGRAGFQDPYTADEQAYAAMNAKIPRGARVLAAVNQPGLLDFSRYTFATLDIPGFVSPPPHIPILGGFDPTMAYLRDRGFDYILTESSAVPGLYFQPQWESNLHYQGVFYRAYAPYFLDWDQIVVRLEDSATHAVQTVGPLSLIRLSPSFQ